MPAWMPLCLPSLQITFFRPIAQHDPERSTVLKLWGSFCHKPVLWSWEVDHTWTSLSALTRDFNTTVHMKVFFGFTKIFFSTHFTFTYYKCIKR